MFYCIQEALSQMRVCPCTHACACVCNSACVNHQLVNCPPPQSGSEVMRVTQYQTKETASPGDSSPLAEPVTAPSPHGRPRTDAHPTPPSLSPSSLTPFLPLRSVAACFLPTCMQAKTHANSPVPSPSRQKLRAPPLLRLTIRVRPRQSKHCRRKGRGNPGDSLTLLPSVLARGKPWLGSINDFFVWSVAECPLFQPPGNSLRPAAVVSTCLFRALTPCDSSVSSPFFPPSKSVDGY